MRLVARLGAGATGWRVIPNLSSLGPATASPVTSNVAVFAPGLITISDSDGAALRSLHARTLYLPGAELEGRVVGYVAVTGNHIENLYIMPDAQGHGVGRALLAAVEQRLTGPMTLRCLTANGRARSLYERCGFAVTREEEVHYHGRTLAAWFMVKAR